MRFDRTGADEQLTADLGRGVATRRQPGDLQFPRRQRGRSTARHRGAAARGSRDRPAAWRPGPGERPHRTRRTHPPPGRACQWRRCGTSLRFRRPRRPSRRRAGSRAGPGHPRPRRRKRRQRPRSAVASSARARASCASGPTISPSIVRLSSASRREWAAAASARPAASRGLVSRRRGRRPRTPRRPWRATCPPHDRAGRARQPGHRPRRPWHRPPMAASCSIRARHLDGRRRWPRRARAAARRHRLPAFGGRPGRERRRPGTTPATRQRPARGATQRPAGPRHRAGPTTSRTGRRSPPSAASPGLRFAHGPLEASSGWPPAGRPAHRASPDIVRFHTYR